MRFNSQILANCWDADIVTGTPGGYLTGWENVKDTLGGLCAANWKANMGTVGFRMNTGGAAPPAPTPAPITPPAPVPSSDNLSIYYAPTTVSSQVTVDMDYSVRVPSVIVADLLDTTYNWYGGGAVAVQPGSGTALITFNVENRPAPGGRYHISTFIISRAAYDADPGNAWTKATKDVNQPVTIALGARIASTESEDLNFENAQQQLDGDDNDDEDMEIITPHQRQLIEYDDHQQQHQQQQHHHRRRQHHHQRQRHTPLSKVLGDLRHIAQDLKELEQEQE